MIIDDDLREELIEYFREECKRPRSGDVPGPEVGILIDLRNRQENKQEIYDYLAKDFDINGEGGANEPMRLAGQMTFQDDYDYWYPLWKGEKQSGLLEPRDPDVIDEYGRKR